MEKNKEDIIKPDDLNMEQKVTVRNLAGWTTGFRRIETVGDVTIPANGTVRLPRSEIIAQVQNGNKLFLGTDYKGSHATLFIDDEPTRIEIDFDNVDEKRTQAVLTAEVVKEMFEIKTIKNFEKKLSELVVTRAEKYAIIEIIRKEKINDFSKNRIVEQYTGFII